MDAVKSLKLQKRKEKFLEAVEIAEKSKKQIIGFIQNLISQLNSRKITREEYEEKLSRALKNRTAEQWIYYYDSYINFYKKQISICEERIKKLKKRSRKITLILIIFIVLIAISSFFTLYLSERNFFKIIGEKISSIFQPSKISEVSITLNDKESVLSEEPLIQYQAVVGKSVKWKKNFVISKETDFILKLPMDSKNIKLKKIENKEEQDLSFSVEERLFIEEIEVKVEKVSESKRTGLVSEERGEYKVEYETPAPEISELEAEGNVIKRVLIKGPDNVHYKDVLSFAELPREFNKKEIGRLKLYEIKNNQRAETRFIAYDTDKNGLVDYIEWLIPELSEVVFELVIEISKAEHLNENKEFISDIYEQVKALDGNWSEPIPAEHYVRVTFKKNLTKDNDITIYARASNHSNNSEECYDKETEILTLNEKGEEEWKLFKDLNDNEKVMTLNAKTGEKEWQLPIERQDFAHNSEMYKVELEDGNNLLVSEEHKVYAAEEELEERETSSLRNFNNLPVENISTLFCFLNDSSDHIPQLLHNAKAKYCKSLSCGETFFASSANLLKSSKEIGSICSFIISNTSEISSEDNLLLLTISPKFLPISVNKYSGEINSIFFNDLFKRKTSKTLPFDNNAENSLLASTTINIIYSKDCLNFSDSDLFTLSDKNLTSSSVSLLLDIIDRSLLLSCNSLLNRILIIKEISPNSSISTFSSSGILTHNSAILTNSIENSDYLSFSIEKNLSEFKLQLITETYQDLQEGRKIYFLDGNNKPIKVKSITKQAYNGKIYDVDVKNDIVLVRKNHKESIKFFNSSVLNTATSHCSLKCASLDQIGIFNSSANARNETSFLCAINLSALSLKNCEGSLNSINSERSEISSLNLSVETEDLEQIVSAYLHNSSSKLGGENNSKENSFNNLFVKEFDLNNEKITLVSITNLIYSSLDIDFLNSLPSFMQSSSVSLDFSKSFSNFSNISSCRIFLTNDSLANALQLSQANFSIFFLTSSGIDNVTVGILPPDMCNMFNYLYSVKAQEVFKSFSSSEKGIWSGNSNQQQAQIEVYRKDDNTLIAKFENITTENWHKIYLTNLSENESYDVFDLKILGEVEFDYIVDPIQALNPIVHANTRLNSAVLTQTQVSAITNDDNNNLISTKGNLLTTEFNDLTLTGTLNDANCSLTYFTDSAFPNEGIFSVYDSFGGNLLDSITITQTTSDRTITLTNLETKGLSLSEVNTIVVQVQNIVSRRPYSIYIDKISCSINNNLPPQITYLQPIPPQTPIENSITTIVFEVRVSDNDGVNDINDSSVNAEFSMLGETTRAGSCSWQSDIDEDTANYLCSVNMQYYDGAGTWNISVYAEDLNRNPAINETVTFQYNLLKAIVISPPEIIWPEIIQGAKNQTPTIPTTINNTGNYNATGRIAIQSMNLYGETDNLEYIDAGNFTVDIGPGEDSCAGFSLINGTNITITNSILESGNLSAGESQEQVYYCLKEVPLVSSQTYSTQQAGSWIITILIASVIIKKKKQKAIELKTNLKKDALSISLNLLSKELKQAYSEEKEKIAKLLIKELKKKYRINNKETAELIKTGKEEIPLEIFSRELGALESVTKYMKENLGMNYHKISLLLNRDERTIWTAYHKSRKKQKEPIIIKGKNVFLPVSIFNKKLTILESVIVYLKKQGIKYSEIAKLLNRDQRNIWTIYSRAVKKIKSKV